MYLGMCLYQPPPHVFSHISGPRFSTQFTHPPQFVHKTNVELHLIVKGNKLLRSEIIILHFWGLLLNASHLLPSEIYREIFFKVVYSIIFLCGYFLYKYFIIVC